MSTNKPKIYDSYHARGLALQRLIDIYDSSGVTRLFYKNLAPNDNSKNQIYLAGHFTNLGYIPTGELVPSDSSSGKTTDPKRKVKFTASLNYRWLAPDGASYQAPSSKLIYYPQFPEVRLSGFVLGSQIDMAGWMDPLKKGRSPGRVLIFGVRSDGLIYAYLAIPGSRISEEIQDTETLEINSVIEEIPMQHLTTKYVADSVSDKNGVYISRDLFEQAEPLPLGSSKAKSLLLNELRRIHLKGPITGQRLNSAGKLIQYQAMNGGGYTLEAELGVTPNGFAEPDFHGWEIKQFGVKRCDLINSKPLTIMTPEPNGGFYAEKGVDAFIREYGYQSKNDRIDFTGRHFMGQVCEKSGLTLLTEGYDSEKGVMLDAGGFIGLADKNETIASKWTFAKLLEHWKKKHAKAAYIPSVANNTATGSREYQYCKIVRLFEGTDFVRLLSAFAQGVVYYDPGINMKTASTKPKIKRRSQFRIKSSSLYLLYQNEESVDVTATVE